MPTPPRGRVPVVLSVLAAATLVVLVWFFGKTADTAVDVPRLSGALWRAGTTEQPLLLYITAQERSRAMRRIGRPSSYVPRPYVRYTLVTRRIPNGDVQDTVHLADRDDRVDERTPQVLGVVGDHAWIWRDSLEGYRISTLERTVTAGTLAVEGGAAVDAIPTEPRGFAVASALRTLAVRGRDARFYRIDATPPRIAPLDPATLPPTTFSTRVEDRILYLVPPERSQVLTHPNSVMQKHFLTTTGLWYALLSETERDQQTSWLSEVDQPNGEVARSLYRTTYRLDGRGLPEIDPRTMRPVGSERLIQGGFLVRGARRVWDVPDPSSSLVLARAHLGAKEPWEVVRLTRDGAVLWRTSTTLADPDLLLDLGTHVALLGREADGRRELVVWIDEATGERRTLSLATGTVQ